MKGRKPLNGQAQLRRTAQEMRKGEWLANAQSRSRASKTIWDVLTLPLGFAMCSGLWWAGVKLALILLHALRPTAPGAAIGFSGDPMKVAGLVLLFSPFMASVAAALLLANAIVYSIPRARRAQADKVRAGGYGINEAQAGLTAFAVLGLAIYAALLAIAILLA